MFQRGLNDGCVGWLKLNWAKKEVQCESGARKLHKEADSFWGTRHSLVIK